MRLPRRTYEGAFHHGMNKGYEGRPIFRTGSDKEVFLELLEKVQALTGTRILAYCVMDNHYHFVLQNESGRMGDFFKQLNGQYALYYRKRYGGKGYVFQDRYKSLLIQDDAYLMVAIAYVLKNPVKSHTVDSFRDYPWSSAAHYFTNTTNQMVDSVFVEELFGNRDELERFVIETDTESLPTVNSPLGKIVGGEDFIPRAIRLAERRSGRESMERRRTRDRYFDPIEKVIREFETIYKVKVDDIDVRTYPGKRLRSALLVLIRERAGMTYREIVRLDLFSDLELNSLGGLYRQARNRMKP